MVTQLSYRRNSLPILMAAAQAGLVILIVLAIGIPSIWAMQRQLVWHARRMLEQAGQTTQALISEQRKDLANLALLTAQRPALQQILSAGETQELPDYLSTLQTAAGLDMILVCDSHSRPISQVGEPISAQACNSLHHTAGFLLNTEGGHPEGWLLASQPVSGGSESVTVVVGQQLSDQYMQDITDWVGLEAGLFFDQQLLATSFSDEGDSRAKNYLAAHKFEPSNSEQSGPLLIDGNSYYYVDQTDAASGLHFTLFFPAAEITSAQRELTRTAGIIMLLVVLLGTGLGYFGARQISRPLGRLRSAADRLRKGDLATTVTVKTRLMEVNQVANALEAARNTLQHSLRRLQQEKDWVDYLLEVVVEGILTIDRRSRITFFSQGAERITGWSADQVLGQTLDDVFQLVDAETRFSQRLPAPGGRQKVVVRLAEGRQAVLAVSTAAQAPPEASTASVVLVLRDVSDEETIRRLLGEFLANIAHEFRTPLTALAASIELLLDQLPELNPQELSELLNSVHLGVISLQTLIDNLLEGASIETGRFRVFPRPTGPNEIINEAVQTMAPLAHKYGQTLEVQAPANLPEVQADPRRTGQVLVNLLSNAIKWSPSGGVIRLSAFQDGGQIVIRVADQGPGIPAERQPDVFLRFDRAHAQQDRGESGAGLGLSVVKAIVEGQGGQVGAHNDPQGGAVFWFSLLINSNGEEDKELAE